MWRIPLSDLNYGLEEEDAVLAVLRSRWLTMGEITAKFESAMASYLGVKHTIAVANCTCALELAFRVLAERHKLDQGAQVLMPSLTFVATANAAISQGLVPVFCDTAAPDHPLLNVDQVAAALDLNPCQGVVLVHYAGFDADSKGIAALCRQRGLFLVEDAAHAIGSLSSVGLRLGTVGDIGCYSFFSNKNLATGEGGLLVTNDDAFAEQVRLLRSHGMTTQTHQRHVVRMHGYDVVVPGHNYRWTEITAALGLEQLKRLDSGNGRRRQLYRRYRDSFRELPNIRLPLSSESEIDSSACHILPALCSSPTLRHTVREALTAAGIQTSHHYPPVHTFSWFRQQYPDLQLPNTESFASREITLPLHPNLPEAAIDEICEILLHTIRAAK